MSIQDLRQRHLKLIAGYSVKHALRGGSGLVYLMILLLFGLSVGHIAIQPVELMEQEAKSQGYEVSREDIMKQLISYGRTVVEWAIGGADPEEEGITEEEKATREADSEEAKRWATYLVDEKPALLSAVLFILIFGQPFVVTFSGFNLVSSDVRSRGIRYQLLRTERANIFLGRYLGTLAFSVASLVLVIATIGLYVGVKLQIYPGALVASWSFQGFLALALVTPPYLALCAWVSTMIDSPFASLVLSKLLIGGIPLLAFIGKRSWEPLAYVKYALPWGIQNYLLHPDLGVWLLAAGGCVLYSVVFLFLGARHFQRCDL